jgi:hypothetical protein
MKAGSQIPVTRGNDENFRYERFAKSTNILEGRSNGFVAAAR